jgi:hypothetical protein
VGTKAIQQGTQGQGFLNLSPDPQVLVVHVENFAKCECWYFMVTRRNFEDILFCFICKILVDSTSNIQTNTQGSKFAFWGRRVWLPFSRFW